MGVSRLDVLQHYPAASPATAAGSSGLGGNGFNYPCNGITTAIVTGTFGGASVFLDFSNDGVNWAPTNTTALTVPGVISFQGAATWVRIRIVGGTSISIVATTCHCDNG